MIPSTSINRSFVRWPLLVLAGLMVSFAGAAATADAQDGYRDRGDRYSRARSEDSGRSRMRSDDNSRFERSRATEQVRRSDNSFRQSSYRPAYNDSFRRDSYRNYDRGSYRDYERDRYRYVKPRYEPRSSLSLSLNYSRPSYHHSRYNYAPTYRSYRSHDYRGPYVYRPAYEPYRPVYKPYYAPVTHVTTTYYGYRPYGYYCPPYIPSYGHYPRYSYPRSSISFGLRYDYRR